MPIWEVSAEFGLDRTVYCIKRCVEEVALGRRSVFIDTEGHFFAEHVEALLGELSYSDGRTDDGIPSLSQRAHDEKCLERIRYMRLHSIHELIAVLLRLEQELFDVAHDRVAESKALTSSTVPIQAAIPIRAPALIVIDSLTALIRQYATTSSHMPSRTRVIATVFMMLHRIAALNSITIIVTNHCMQTPYYSDLFASYVNHRIVVSSTNEEER